VGVPLVRINAGTFGAVGAGVAIDLNIVAMNQAGPVKDRIPPRLLRGTVRGTIEDIVLYYTTSLMTGPSCGVYFWGKDTHNTGLATAHLWGMETFAAAEWTRETASTGPNLIRAHVGGISIPYADDDNTGEFHVTFENDDAALNLAAGSVRFEFGYRPEFGG